MSTLLLVRSAQASFGSGSYDALSSLGQAQAVALAEELRARGVVADQIVTGTLRRQQETAVAFAAGSAVQTDSRWDELDIDALLDAYNPQSPGRLSGDGDVDAFQDALDGALLRWIAGPGPDDVETWTTFSMRAGAASEELLGSLGPQETAVVFTSAGVLAAVASGRLGLRGSGFLSFNRSMVNTGITKVIRDGRGDTLISFNDHGHLGRPGGPAASFR